MDLVTSILLTGFVGGLAMAWLIRKAQRRGQMAADPFPHMAGTDVINMAQIRVAGVGGLGLVAMAAAVAIWVPRIGQSLALGLALGAGLAAYLILRRRRTGPMPSSGRSAGANTTLSIETAASETTPTADRSDGQQLAGVDAVATS
jgi:hypothetical protein